MNKQETQEQTVTDRAKGYTAALACIAAEGLAVARAAVHTGLAAHAESFGFWCGWLHACATCCARDTAK